MDSSLTAAPILLRFRGIFLCGNEKFPFQKGAPAPTPSPRGKALALLFQGSYFFCLSPSGGFGAFVLPNK